MSETADLTVQIGSVSFRNPFIVGSGPTVKNVDQITRAQDNGWAGVSIKLAMEPEPYISLPPRYRWIKKNKYHIFTAESRLTTTASLKLLEEARKAAPDIIVIPNITYDGKDRAGWARLAKRFEAAGAEIIELNMCCPNMSYNLTATGELSEQATGASLGMDLAELEQVVKQIVDAVSVPIVVKLTPEGGKIAQAAQLCLQAGASAVGNTANRLGIPDIDIRNPMHSIYRLQDGITMGCLSGPWLRPLALRDTYEMRKFLGQKAFIIGSGGVSDLQSAVQQIMVGADAIWICTETMLRGFSWLPQFLEDLKNYMLDMGYRNIADFRDLLHRNIKNAGELQTYKGHAQVDLQKCNTCGLCWRIGHCPAITHPEGITTIDIAECLACSTCVDVCPRRAICMIPD